MGSEAVVVFALIFGGYCCEAGNIVAASGNKIEYVSDSKTHMILWLILGWLIFCRVMDIIVFRIDNYRAPIDPPNAKAELRRDEKSGGTNAE